MSLLNTLRYPIVLFDLGSTLIYFDGDWLSVLAQSQETLVQSLTESGYPVNPEVFPRVFGERLDAYRLERDNEYIEYTTFLVLRNLLAETGYREVPVEILRKALKDMYAVTEACWKIESDTIAALESLCAQGRRLGLVSNASDDADVQALVDQSNIRRFFDVIVTSAAVGRRKPNPAIFHRALDFWNASPRQAVMVGDTYTADIFGAHNLGMASIWITRRVNLESNPLSGVAIPPDAVVENLSSLPEIISQWEEKYRQK